MIGARMEDKLNDKISIPKENLKNKSHWLILKLCRNANYAIVHLAKLPTTPNLNCGNLIITNYFIMIFLSVNLSRNSTLNYHNMHLKITTRKKVIAPFSKYGFSRFLTRLG